MSSTGTFERAFAFVVSSRVEGGFTDDPRDPGNWTGGAIGKGELKGTNHGVSAAAYPNEDIRNLTIDRARYLFKRDFWDRVRGDDLPDGVAIALFDIAINMGVDDAPLILQRALGVKVDGQIGPVTVSAAWNQKPLDVVAEIAVERVLAYQGYKNWELYRRTWLRRTVLASIEAMS